MVVNSKIPITMIENQDIEKRNRPVPKLHLIKLSRFISNNSSQLTTHIRVFSASSTRFEPCIVSYA